MGYFYKAGKVQKYRSKLQGEGMLSPTRSKKPLGRGCGLCFYGKSSEDREQTEASRPGIGRKYERITNVVFFFQGWGGERSWSKMMVGRQHKCEYVNTHCIGLSDCMCTYVCPRVCRGMHAYVEIKSQPQVLVLRRCPPCLLRQDLSMAWNSLFSLGLLARKTRESTCLLCISGFK